MSEVNKQLNFLQEISVNFPSLNFEQKLEPIGALVILFTVRLFVVSNPMAVSKACSRTKVAAVWEDQERVIGRQ